MSDTLRRVCLKCKHSYGCTPRWRAREYGETGYWWWRKTIEVAPERMVYACPNCLYTWIEPVEPTT